MVSDPVRCGLSFANVGEFDAAFIARGVGLCFVAYPDEIDTGRAVLVDVVIADRARLELEGEVRNPDFDERGNTGVIVSLSPDSSKAVEQLHQDLAQGEVPETFTTTRMHRPRTAKIVGGEAQQPTETEALFEPGAMIDERFRIEAHIATGGMGEVYRANHVHLKRPVALKLLRRALASDPEMWGRFQREAELVSQLESPHVVRVFDFGRTEAGQPYLAMEYVEGTTLDVELEKGPLEPARAIALLQQICEGLGEAHALGVIHRDLKPANLIIGHRRDGSEVLKVLDFGIARLSGGAARSEKQKLTQLGVTVGTPAYLSPEQALADDVDLRTDLYSLGCVAYELLTGRPPFSAPELSKVISMHLTAVPPSLPGLRPELEAWPALCAVVLKALAKERDKRFSSTAEFSRALAEAADRTRAPQDWAAEASEPDAWPPDNTPAPVPRVSAAAVDDFFGDSGAATPAAVPEAPRKGLAELVSTQLEGQLAAARAALSPSVTRGLFLFAEVLGAPLASAAAKACLSQVLSVTAAFGGFVEKLDDDGLLLGFASERALGESRTPAQRGALAALSMRDAVADEATRQGVPARLRATLIAAELREGSGGQALERARALGGRAPAGTVVLERGLGPELGALELGPGHAADALQVLARKPVGRRSTELLGRSGLLESFDRRLAGLAQGVVAPLVIRGPAGSGRTSLALELAARARQRSMIATVACATPGWKRAPGSALVAMLCAVCGVPVESRERLLRPALEALRLPASLIEAVLVVAGVSQAQWAFTPGQAAHALRSVLRAGAGERQVVLIFDGLEHLDEPSLEAFGELVTRPAAKELTIGFTSQETPAERLGGTAVLEVPTLTGAEVARVVQLQLGVPPAPRLLTLLQQRSEGLPARLQDWLGLLEDRGALRVSGAAVDLVDEPPQALEPAALSRARHELLPLDTARLLEAAWCLGETFEPAMVAIAWPRANQQSFQLAAAARLVLPGAGRRWSFSSPRVRTAVGELPSRERPAMHLRLALSLVEQGKANPANVSPLEVGRQFLLAGDGVRAAALFQHAAEQALARRAGRDAVPALKGLADALALSAPQPPARRLEALARAASLSLAAQDAHSARALLDEALRLAGAGPLSSGELALSQARVLRSEARRARAAEALQEAQALAQGSVLSSLVDVERAETLEQEGDPLGAMVAFEAALLGAPAAAALACWHGEVELTARIEARLATLSLQQRDVDTARRLFESSALRWRAAAYPPGEARALSNWGAACAVARDLPTAQKCFAAAADAAARSGDFLFQARALLQQAKALKKLEPASPQVASLAGEARRLAVALGWEQGREDATALSN